MTNRIGATIYPSSGDQAQKSITQKPTCGMGLGLWSHKGSKAGSKQLDEAVASPQTGCIRDFFGPYLRPI